MFSISALFVSKVYPSATCEDDISTNTCTFSGYNEEELNSYCRFTCNCDVECNAMLVMLIPNRFEQTTYEIQEVSWQPVADYY